MAATIFFQEDSFMDTEKSQYDDVGRKVIIIERDSGIGWAVAFIVLAIAIGFGVIFFMDQQSMIEYKIEKAVLKLQNENVAKGGVLDLQLPSRAGLFNPNEALWTGGEVKSNAGEPSRSASIGGAVTR
jgi:hypothetical protein